MALIGQIAIGMGVDTKKLAAGLATARAALGAFEASARKDLGGGLTLVREGFADIVTGTAILKGQVIAGAVAIGAGLGGMVASVINSGRTLGSMLSRLLDPALRGARSGADSLRDVFASRLGGTPQFLGGIMASVGAMFAALAAQAGALATSFDGVAEGAVRVNVVIIRTDGLVAGLTARVIGLGNAIEGVVASRMGAMGQIGSNLNDTVFRTRATFAATAKVVEASSGRMSSAMGAVGRRGKEMAPRAAAVAVGIVRIADGARKAGTGLAMMGVGIAKLAIPAAVEGIKDLTVSFVGFARESINQLGKFSAAAALVAGFGIKSLVTGAMALGEQTDRARVIFGKYADVVIAQSDLMAGAYGTSRKQFVASASAFASMFKGVGYGQEQSAKLSNHFVMLAANLSSLTHVPFEEALEKLQSGLAGQVRPLREVGVFMSEEGIAAEAARMGIARLGAELTESQKIQARVSFLTNALSDANGNLALTAGSAANQTRSLMGRLENLADAIGTALLGVVGPVLDELNTGIQALQIAWDQTSIAAASSTAGVVNGAQQQSTSIGWIQQSIGFAANAWSVLRLGFMAMQSVVTGGIAGLVGTLATLQDAILAVVNVIPGIEVKGSEFLRNWSKDLGDLAGKQWGDLQKELAKPWPSETVDEYFTKARLETEELRNELAKPAASVLGMKPDNAPAVAKPAGEIKFASAQSASSQEGVNALLRSRHGSGVPRDKAGDQTARNTAETTKAIKDLPTRLAEILARALAPAPLGNF